MSNSAVGNFRPNKGLAHSTPESITHGDRSLFRLGDALLETAIAVTCVRIGHARNEHEHDDAFAELEDLRSQRERSAWATAEAARAQLRVDIDNRIQDHLHQQMDAERDSGGKSLAEYFAGQK
jgi:hypothetical protein